MWHCTFLHSSCSFISPSDSHTASSRFGSKQGSVTVTAEPMSGAPSCNDSHDSPPKNTTNTSLSRAPRIAADTCAGHRVHDLTLDVSCKDLAKKDVLGGADP
jgi:hypothetical protein